LIAFAIAVEAIEGDDHPIVRNAHISVLDLRHKTDGATDRDLVNDHRLVPIHNSVFTAFGPKMPAGQMIATADFTSDSAMLIAFAFWIRQKGADDPSERDQNHGQHRDDREVKHSQK
jgi:hypothetical protein